jgi:hypothetical protein
MPQLRTAHGNALVIFFNLHHISGRILQKVEEGYLCGERTKVSCRQDFEKRAHRSSQIGTSQIVQTIANLLLEQFLLLNLKLHSCATLGGSQIPEPQFTLLCTVCDATRM